MDSDELFSKREHIIDMMLSAHARLRDRYVFRSSALDIAILAGSVLLCATVLLDIQDTGLSAQQASFLKYALAFLSSSVFFLSLVALRVDWKGRSERHRAAYARLARLKAMGQAVNASQKSLTEFHRDYDNEIVQIEAIPDRSFAALKAYHLRKVALSRMVSQCPGAPLWTLRLRLWVEAIKGLTIGRHVK